MAAHYDLYITTNDGLYRGTINGGVSGVALLGLQGLGTLRAAAVRSTSPSAALDTLNQVLLIDESDRFCTANFIRLRQIGDRWKLATSSGGHPLPLLIRAGEAPAELGEPGALLGVADLPSHTDTEAVLEPGDMIVLYTAHRYGWTPIDLGVFVAALAASSIAVQALLAGRIAAWLGERRTVLAGLALQIAGYIGSAGHLGEIVDGEGIGVQRPAKVAKVNRIAASPEHAMCCWGIHAISRGSHRLV